MAQVVLPQKPFSGMDIAMGRDTPEHRLDETGTSRNSASSPNHTFIFPEQPHPDTPTASHERIVSSAAHRRTTSRQRPSNLSINALPSFEFGFPPNSPTNLVPSPSRSPVRLTPPGSHTTGHKRGGSEFVGGDLTQGGPVLVSTSPTASEEVAPAPPSPRKVPPAGRRGHAHRRSGAVSQSDVKTIMQPASEQKCGSAPSTPSEPAFCPTKPPAPGRSNSQPGTTNGSDSTTDTPSYRPTSGNGQPRSRVGFSDVLEFIPRPLSTISSETSSSMSTIRAGHSVTDSISSIVSGQAPSPPSIKATAPSEKHGLDEGLLARRVYSQSSSRVGAEEDGSTNVTDTLFGHPSLPQREGRTAKMNNPHTGTVTAATHINPFEAGKMRQQVTGNAVPSFDNSLHSWVDRPRPTSLQSSPLERPRTSPEPKVTKRQHKVKSWAGSILHRKDRQTTEDVEHFKQLSQISTQKMTADPDFSLEDVTFDDDTTLIIEEPAAPPSRPFGSNPNFPTERPVELTSTSNVEASNPMIDIDAALSSPSSPSHDLPYDDYFGRFSNAKRRLHSSGETGGFTGPGMHYHRRAESVPLMPSVDHATCSIPRLSSNSAMNEAIEEEEEDADQDATQRDQQISGLGVNIIESEVEDNQPMRRRQSGHSAAEDKQRGRNCASTPPNTSAPDPVEIVDAEEEPRFSVLTKSSDETTITPTLSQDPLSSQIAAAPLDSALQTPSLTYGTTPETPSAVSSAEYSKTSFDFREIPRTHTANSSITDRVTLNSSKAGDYGTGSMDDVPSLTSSASTMFSGHPTRFSSSGNTTSSAERSSSSSAAVPARTRLGSSSKRSSLASLSRLVGGSYNRSRLNIEETVPPDSPEKPEKKKRRRISRMMHFWKSKEKLSIA